MAVVGRYVRRFADADMGMLEGASLNAPYAFHWVTDVRVDGASIVCKGAGKPLALPFRRTAHGDRATITINDPIFGPTKFEVHPFKRSES
ncbi:hypothetical protein [uncultured Sphingomonas sp.]|jgi:hypothetical protein|uniref:hypothetical protein n=1 Tax=uncultured Sphingomonas sp. TaxID=158754 RepID=UPI0030DB21D4